MSSIPKTIDEFVRAPKWWRTDILTEIVQSGDGVTDFLNGLRERGKRAYFIVDEILRDQPRFARIFEQPGAFVQVGFKIRQLPVFKQHPEIQPRAACDNGCFAARGYIINCGARHLFPQPCGKVGFGLCHVNQVVPDTSHVVYPGFCRRYVETFVNQP